MSDKPNELRLLHTPRRIVDVHDPALMTLLQQMLQSVMANHVRGLSAVQIACGDYAGKKPH